MTDSRAFDSLPGDQVIRPKFLATYQRRWGHFFLQLGRLRDNVYLLQRLLDFPFELFGTERFGQLLLPETHPNDWGNVRSRMSKAKLATLDRLREKRGLGPVTR